MSDKCCSNSNPEAANAAAPPPASASASSCCGGDVKPSVPAPAVTSCCGPTATSTGSESGCCDTGGSRVDYLLWGSLVPVAILYGHYLLAPQTAQFATWYHTLSHSVFELINTMWWGVVLGVVMLAVLAKVPREFVMSVLGTDRGAKSIVRAAAAGVLLDLCNHGILMVGAKLYERGASLGQVMAFLIASPWNSLSLTLVLVALIGLPWTLAFIVLSMLIALVTGVLFNHLVDKGVLPKNPNTHDLPADFQFWAQAKSQLRATRFDLAFIKSSIIAGIKDSQMVMRWLLFGVLLAALVRALVPPDWYAAYLGPSLVGLMITVLAATVIEVCSEGSTPLAADILTRAGAPGNSFAFLMAGAATDYTEVMVMRDATKSWKCALFLPLLTVPQVMLIAWVMNAFA